MSDHGSNRSWDHVRRVAKYGNYGVGLTKEWANINGLNPVFYMSKHSPITAAFLAGVFEFGFHLETIQEIRTLTEAHMNILNMCRYIKNYEGDLTRMDGSTTPNYRFADEREWRYVPPPRTKDVRTFVTHDKIQTDKQKAHLNASIAHLRLQFHPEDIRYLIVEQDSERTEVIEHLEHAKRRFDKETRRRLASRILTADQIKNDV